MASHAAAQLLAVALGVPGEVPTGPDHTEPALSLACLSCWRRNWASWALPSVLPLIHALTQTRVEAGQSRARPLSGIGNPYL